MGEVRAVLPDDAAATVQRILRVAFPHPGFPDGPYERTTTAILEGVSQDRRLQAQFVQGLQDLRMGYVEPFVDLPDVDALVAVEQIAGTGFFQSIRGTAITALYSDTEVWELLGYEGASYDKGGYLTRGFDDLDWLPEPSLDRAADVTEEARA